MPRLSVSFQEMPEVMVMDIAHRKSVRSSKSSVSSEGLPYSVGSIVFAHKGQAVQHWRPGVVVEIKLKGYYVIRFFGDLVQHDCTKSSMMNFTDFENRRKKI